MVARVRRGGTAVSGRVRQHGCHRLFPPVVATDGPSFSYYNNRVEVHFAARKHGVADPDILHAIEHALALQDAGEDPDRWPLIGSDMAGNLIEVVIMITAGGTQIVIHAVPMRDQSRRLLGL